MADLSLSYPPGNTPTVITNSADTFRRVLIRKGEKIPANTAIDINDPGIGWHVEGVDVTFSGSEDFIKHGQVYRNGQILLTGSGMDSNNDVYFVSISGTLAFDSPIRTNDIIQIWD